MSECIALVSGKGGSGKTATALSLAYLAADLDIRTLLVDADLATHGMTYFFVDRLQTPGVQGSVYGYDPDKSGLIGVLELSTSLHFLPSVPSIARRYDVTDMPDLTRLESLFNRLTNLEYDLIIIDCQAGTSLATAAAVRAASTTLVVTEADPVSIWAVNDLLDEMQAYVGGRVLGLVNKAMKEEQAYFQALVDITQRIRYLDQLPFDLDVRRAYFRREVPVNISNPSPYLLTLAGAMVQLSPALNKAASVLEKWSLEDRLKDLRRERNDLLHARRTIVRDSYAASPSRRFYRQFILLLMYMLALVPPLLTGVGYFTDYSIKDSLTIAAPITGGIAFAIIAAYWVFMNNETYTPRVEFEVPSGVLRELEQRISETEVALESLQGGSSPVGSLTH